MTLTDALSIAAIAISLLTLSITFLTQRKSLRFQITDYRISDDMAFFFMSFENKSRLPIAVTRVQIQLTSKMDCVSLPTLVLETWSSKRNIETSRKDFYSLQMPIALNSLGAVSGYVLFHFPKNSFPPNATQVNFLISTNRGKAIQKTLALPLDENSVQSQF